MSVDGLAGISQPQPATQHYGGSLCSTENQRSLNWRMRSPAFRVAKRTEHRLTLVSSRRPRSARTRPTSRPVGAPSSEDCRCPDPHLLGSRSHRMPGVEPYHMSGAEFHVAIAPHLCTSEPDCPSHLESIEKGEHLVRTAGRLRSSMELRLVCHRLRMGKPRGMPEYNSRIVLGPRTQTSKLTRLEGSARICNLLIRSHSSHRDD